MRHGPSSSSIILLALGSVAGSSSTLVFVVGCRTADPAATTSPSTQTSTATPNATSMPTTTTTMTNNMTTGDAGGPRETIAIWSPLRWEMDRPTAADALRKAGYVVTDKGPTKTPSTIVSADVGRSKLAVYFDEKGAMNQILLTTESVPEDEARTLRTKLDGRFGTATQDQRSIEKRWKLASDGHITVRVGQRDRGWFVHQERGRGYATTGTPLGWSDLAWGANAAETEAKLKAAGFTTKTRAPSGIDGCKLPNAPPNCVSTPSTELEFTKTEGTAVVTSGFLSISSSSSKTMTGLGQISIDKKGFADQTTALAEFAPIEKANGNASSTTRAQHISWQPGSGEVALDVSQSDGKWSAIEAYRPTVEQR